MPLIPIDSLDDPRVTHYRNLKDRDLAREGDRFIAEGELVVRRLLASRFPTESVLIADRHVPEISSIVPEHIPVFVAPAQVVHSILGYKFHSGVMAVGRRLPSPSLEELIQQNPRSTFVVCPELANTENLGVITRIAAAFDVTGLILGPNCCDPFYRQSVRVSMGATFTLPIVQSPDLKRDLLRLHTDHACELLATVLAEDAEPLHAAKRPDRIALLLGNEAQGLSNDWIEICDRKITIPMPPHTDSLNVSIAAGIFLYHFTQLT